MSKADEIIKASSCSYNLNVLASLNYIATKLIASNISLEEANSAREMLGNMPKIYILDKVGYDSELAYKLHLAFNEAALYSEEFSAISSKLSMCANMHRKKPSAAASKASVEILDLDKIYNYIKDEWIQYPVNVEKSNILRYYEGLKLIGSIKNSYDEFLVKKLILIFHQAGRFSHSVDAINKLKIYASDHKLETEIKNDTLKSATEDAIRAKKECIENEICSNSIVGQYTRKDLDKLSYSIGFLFSLRMPEVEERSFSHLNGVYKILGLPQTHKLLNEETYYEAIDRSIVIFRNASNWPNKSSALYDLWITKWLHDVSHAVMPNAKITENLLFEPLDPKDAEASARLMSAIWSKVYKSSNLEKLNQFRKLLGLTLRLTPLQENEADFEVIQEVCDIFLENKNPLASQVKIIIERDKKTMREAPLVIQGADAASAPASKAPALASIDARADGAALYEEFNNVDISEKLTQPSGLIVDGVVLEASGRVSNFADPINLESLQ